jgi:hypothetical protein
MSRRMSMGLLISGVLAGTAIGVEAQEEPRTLLGGGVTLGAYGGLGLRSGSVMGERSVFMGGEAAWVPNQRLILGAAVWALASDGARVAPDLGPITLGYAGMLIGYRLAPERVVHPTVSLLLGAGGLRSEGTSGGSAEDDALFVAEPAAGAELNVTSFLRIAVGASYRWISGTDLAGVSDADLSGVTGEFAVRLGRF